MKRMMVITLEPKHPAVFSARSATVGAHQTLDAPTGANLLGWAAAHCYELLEAAIYDGRLRFSNAVRIVNDLGAFRNPAILLEPKPKEISGPACLGREKFVAVYGKTVQAKTVKDKLLTLGGEQAPKPQRVRRLRTAIKDGVADEGRLFGYQAVEPGATCLRATIEADDVSDDAWATLRSIFADQTLYLGRGAASGYGGAYSCKIVEDEKDPWPGTDKMVSGNALCFWLLSDVCLADEWGGPRLHPRASDFGLQDQNWKLVPSKSSATTRRVWPWNGTYKSRDMEMAVINAGSVFTFERERDDGPETLHRLIGIGHERGFGRYAVLPMDIEFAVADSVTDDSPKPPTPPEHDTALMAFAKARGARSLGFANVAWADQQIAKVEVLINQLGGDGPGASQWSRLGEIVESLNGGDASARQQLQKLLRGQAWQAGFDDLAVWVEKDLLGKQQSPSPAAADLQRVIAHARSAAQRVA